MNFAVINILSILFHLFSFCFILFLEYVKKANLRHYDIQWMSFLLKRSINLDSTPNPSIEVTPQQALSPQKNSSIKNKGAAFSTLRTFRAEPTSYQDDFVRGPSWYTPLPRIFILWEQQATHMPLNKGGPQGILITVVMPRAAY